MNLRKVLAAAAAIGLLVEAGAQAQAQPETRGAGAPEASAVTLVDHRGRPVTFADFRGSFVLVFFGYTHCPDICPTDLTILAAALDALGAPGERVQPVFITLDPERDTAEVLAAYVAKFHPRLIGLTGAPADIRAVADRYRVRYKTFDPDDAGGGNGAAVDDYFLDHTAATYVVGPGGRVLGLFQHGTPATDIAAAIRPLLD